VELAVGALENVEPSAADREHLAVVGYAGKTPHPLRVGVDPVGAIDSVGVVVAVEVGEFGHESHRARWVAGGVDPQIDGHQLASHPDHFEAESGIAQRNATSRFEPVDGKGELAVDHPEDELPLFAERPLRRAMQKGVGFAGVASRPIHDPAAVGKRVPVGPLGIAALPVHVPKGIRRKLDEIPPRARGRLAFICRRRRIDRQLQRRGRRQIAVGRVVEHFQPDAVGVVKQAAVAMGQPPREPPEPRVVAPVERPRHKRHPNLLAARRLARFPCLARRVRRVGRRVARAGVFRIRCVRNHAQRKSLRLLVGPMRLASLGQVDLRVDSVDPGQEATGQQNQ
jgi:hypothetical protein